MYQIATGTCPAAFTNNTAGQKLLLPVTQGSGGVKALYFAVPGIVRCAERARALCFAKSYYISSEAREPMLHRGTRCMKHAYLLAVHEQSAARSPAYGTSPSGYSAC